MEESTSNMGGTKTCPECAENVQAAALVCRFCGHRFGGEPAPVGPEEASTSGAAVASFICSLLGLWIAAIPLGIHAQRQIDNSAGRKTGRGFATAGIVIGILGMTATAIVIIAVVAASKSHKETPAKPATIPVATEGTKPLWRPSDPNKAPSETQLGEVGLAKGEFTETAAGKLMPLLNKGNPANSDEARLTRRNCVLTKMGYGQENEATENKWAWLLIALTHHEGAAEEAVQKAAAACAAQGE